MSLSRLYNLLLAFASNYPFVGSLIFRSGSGLCHWYCVEWYHLEPDNHVPETITREERKEKRLEE